MLLTAYLSHQAHSVEEAPFLLQILARPAGMEFEWPVLLRLAMKGLWT